MTIDPIIEVEKRTVYGSDFIYPVNAQALLLCDGLNGQKTFTPENIVRFKKMGFIFKQVVVANGKNIEVGEL